MNNLMGISLGDVTGVGPEVTLKALALEAAADQTRYLLIGDMEQARRVEQLGFLHFEGLALVQQAAFFGLERLQAVCRYLQPGQQ